MNNRQNGRRRGRGGQQSRNGQPGNPHSNSRVDNRQRGNAAQLLEKYKTLARDAQMQGDRVNTEYYLQFADHYFRVLSENRSRFEEQRRPQGDYGTEEDGEQQPQQQRGYMPQNFSDDAWDDGDDDRRDEVQAPQPPQRTAQPRNEQPRDDRPRGDQSRNDQARADQPRGDQSRVDQSRGDQPRNDQPRNARGDQPRGDRRPPRGQNRADRDGAAAVNGHAAATDAPAGNGAGRFADGDDEATSERIGIALPPALNPAPPAPQAEPEPELDMPSAEAEPVLALEGEAVAPPKRRRTRKPKATDVAQAEA